jgi:PhoH-like ATPase
MSKKLFILDTNVLMHDPSCLFRFQEHDIFLPMMVLEELDRGKRGMTEIARNVRQVSRFMDGLMAQFTTLDIEDGLPLPMPLSGIRNGDNLEPGRLFFQTRNLPHSLPDSLPGQSPDNAILSIALALQDKYKGRQVILVSKDINMRIKANVLGLRSEDYSSDQVLDDIDLLYRGMAQLPDNFWDSHSKDLEAWEEEGRSFYRVTGPDTANWHPNQCLYMEDGSQFEALVRRVDEQGALIEHCRDYRSHKHAIWGISARNREQNIAMNMLMDPQLDFVTLLGAAGTGKTLLALAAGLTQVLEKSLYSEIIMTRVTIPVGEDIGFLPGTEEEKMTPWMGALMDNLEVLTRPDGGSWGRAATSDLLKSRIRIHSMNFMRGRTFLKKYLIIDEAQNLTPKQMKTLITRAGPETKVVCLGNLAQIDTPYLTETTSGLTYVVDHFKPWAHSGHITLQRGERSRLADFANDSL